MVRSTRGIAQSVMLLAAAGAALFLGGCKPAASNSRVPSPPPAPNVTTPARSTAPAPAPAPTPSPAVTPAPAAASASTPSTPVAHPNNNTPLIPAEPSGGGGNTVLMPSKVRDKLGQSGYQTRKSDAGVTTTPSDAGGGE